MINLLLYFFLFIPFSTNAATINPIDLSKKNSELIQQSKESTIDIFKTQTEPTSKNITYPLDNNALSYKANNNVNVLRLNNQTSGFPQNKMTPQPRSIGFENFTQKLKQEYGNNQLVQDSLTTIYQVKQVWHDLDTQANAFTADLLFSLQLDKYINNDPISIQLGTQINSNKTYLEKTKTPGFELRETYPMSFYQVENISTTNSSKIVPPLISKLVAAIFQAKTLYYLIGLAFLFIILQWIIKFSLRFFP